MFLGFGEVMLRLCPEGHLRLRQVLPGRLEATFAGAEANVCASLAMLGAETRLLTAVPDNPLVDALVGNLRGLGVDTRFIRRSKEGRLGIYFVETGANQRGSTVVYDRHGSTISLVGPEAYDYDAALAGVHWVHLTGITPSLSEPAFQATLELARRAQAVGATVSCDLNFRKKLWLWRRGVAPGDLARNSMEQILPHVDLVIANEEDAADVLDIHAPGVDVERGQLNADAYVEVARAIGRRFPNVSRVAITLRESVSADHNNWGGLLWQRADDTAHFAPIGANGHYQPYEIRDIVDRVGGGDSFGAGLLYALNSAEYAEGHRAIAFAVAASCLKHSIRGDFNYVTLAEIEALVAGAATGRVRR